LKSKQTGLFVGLAVFAIVFVVVASTCTTAYHQYSLGSIGYSSAFEGPKARFYGVSYNGNHYTATQTNGASLSQFDTVMHFDADGTTTGKPNIVGEMTTVFLPEQTASNLASWMPTSWIQNNGLINNPEKTYSWNVTGKDYVMHQYDMRYYQTFTAEWDGERGTVIDGSHENPGGGYMGISGAENNYGGLEVWTELDLTPSWYIQGGGIAYFAVAKMQLAENAIFAGKDNNNNPVNARGDVSVSPESRLSPVYMYYEPFGSAQVGEKTAATYQGQTLNSAYFTDKLYFHFDFNKFGVYGGSDYLLFPFTKGDKVTIAFDLKVFVIGEYTVKDIQQDPGDSYGRFSKGTTTTPTFLSWLLDTPYGNFFLALIIIGILAVIGFVLAAVYAPWLLGGVSALMGKRK
jgi:hypothetical protein